MMHACEGEGPEESGGGREESGGGREESGGGREESGGGREESGGGREESDGGREGSGDRRRAAAARAANLLGAVSLAAAERLEQATTEAAAHGGSAPAALNALETYLDRSSIDAMRRPLGLTHSAAVRLVDRLAAAGLVKREPGTDARSLAISVTESGRRAAREVRRRRERALTGLLAPLSAAEREQLARLHEKLLEGITSGREDAGHICRLCDAEACGHYEGRCPVTRAADRAAAQ